MNINYIVHDETGRIVKRGICPDTMLNLQAHEEGWTALATDQQYDDDKFWVVDNEVVERPDMPIVVEGSTIKGIPAGALMTIEHEVYEADGTDIEVTTSLPGLYQIQIENFPYKLMTVEVQT